LVLGALRRGYRLALGALRRLDRWALGALRRLACGGWARSITQPLRRPLHSARAHFPTGGVGVIVG